MENETKFVNFSDTLSNEATLLLMLYAWNEFIYDDPIPAEGYFTLQGLQDKYARARKELVAAGFMKYELNINYDAGKAHFDLEFTQLGIHTVCYMFTGSRFVTVTNKSALKQEINYAIAEYTKLAKNS